MRRIIILGITSFLLIAPCLAHANYAFNAFPDLPLFSFPMGAVDPMDGTDRLFVPERAGMIQVFQNDPTVSTRTLFLDISGLVTTQTEGGLLGLAFHPDYENNRYFYVTFTAENPRREVLARYSADPSNPNVALPGSQLLILEVAKINLHHNGGQIAFGADGYLYWSLGEDGVALYAQDVEQLHGKVLRLDVDNPSGGNQYGIPADNPFVGVAGRDEIWALGFRNPWRFSFDSPTGRLWLADVGQDSWEEINIVLKGRNYGWPRMEGNNCLSPPECDTTGLNLVPPLHAYPHVGGASVTGGFVYRGSRLPSLVGKYIYADFITDQVWSLSWDGVNPPVISSLLSQFNVPSFGIDKDGEVFMVSFDGNIYELFLTTTSVRTPLSSARLSVAPNPFQTATAITYSLAVAADVALEVFDVAGRRVTTIVDRAASDGPAVVQWDGRDTSGNKVRSGVYFVRMSVNGKPALTRRVTFLK